MSLEEIGKSLDLTRERVRQIKVKGIKKLQGGAKKALLKKYEY
jgi:RNA polymerase primary sigma factor